MLVLGLAKWLAGISTVACDGNATATASIKKTGGNEDSAGSSFFLYGAAAASTLALAITAGYHYYSEVDEGSEGLGQNAKSKAEEEAGAEQALTQARESLHMEWTQTTELHKASNGQLGFEAWYVSDPGSSYLGSISCRKIPSRSSLLLSEPPTALGPCAD